MIEQSLAGSPQELSAKRAKIFEAAASEIERIGLVKNEDLVKGSIGVGFDAINRVLGKNERDTAKLDADKLNLLTEAAIETFKIRIRNPAHLFCELRKRVGDESTVYNKKSSERAQIRDFMRCISRKLCNGHAGVWI